MKKTLPILGILAVALVLSGCGQNAAIESGTPTDAPKTATEQKDGSVIGSIKDAMGLGTKMKCDYSMKTADGKTFDSVAYIEGKKYRGESMIAGIKNNMVFDGETMYLWSEGSKTGMKMSQACTKELAAKVPQGQPGAETPTAAPEDQFKNALDTKCVPSSGADFSIPTDIVFTDQCEMLKKTTEMLKNLPQGSVPKNIPGAPAAY